MCSKPLHSVVTGTSLHGALPDAWILERSSAKATLALAKTI